MADPHDEPTMPLLAEVLRANELTAVNQAATERAALEAREGQVWNTDELARDFEVQGFMAPFVVARRRSDGKVGSLKFQHHPRLYFGWEEDRRG